jgi:hypothetical protein
MATVWITYAWVDNAAGDVDYVAQELQAAGLTVKLDRWHIGAGRRLWEQIAGFIGSADESDAWLLIATTNSLQSEACKEEFAYALDRALNKRGATYPVIALFRGPADSDLIPAGIKTRLFVSITDPDWKERVVAAAQGRKPQIAPVQVQPYVLRLHQNTVPQPYAIELRPRAGVWMPFFVAVPSDERDRVQPSIMIGPRDVPTFAGALMMSSEATSGDGQWWVMSASNQANPTMSYYVWCQELPTKLAFGVQGRQPQYIVTVDRR